MSLKSLCLEAFCSLENFVIEILECCTFKIDFQAISKTPCNWFYTEFIILLFKQSHYVYYINILFFKIVALDLQKMER